MEWESSARQQLEKGTASFIGNDGELALEFKNDAGGTSFHLTEKGVENLMMVLPTVSLKMAEMAAKCEVNDNHVFCSYTLSQRGSNSVRLEGSVFAKKVYLFLKPYFMPKLSQSTGEAVPDARLEVEGPLARDEELDAFLSNLRGRKLQEPLKWLPRQGGLQLGFADIAVLQKFINAQYAN